MKLPGVLFRILLPAVYLVVVGLFIAGMIITIAEGPNPFGFLFYPAFYPSTLLFDVLLPHSSFWAELNGWVLMLFDVLVNLVVYFLLGYVIDYSIRRLRG